MSHHHGYQSRADHRAHHQIGGRQELGQNALVDPRFPAEMAEILRHAPPLPVVELGAGDGAITRALLAAGLKVTAVELDPGKVARLRATVGAQIEIVEADLLRFDFGNNAHHLVSNVPFSITSPLFRRLFELPLWHTAVLLTQWEVAKKRAAVGGTTLMTASWWPWFDFSLAGRVPARAFAPVPSVDGGILVIRRREEPRLPAAERASYQRLVRFVFTGRGRGLGGILRSQLGDRSTRAWLAEVGLNSRCLPRDLSAEQWISLDAALRRSRR